MLLLIGQHQQAKTYIKARCTQFQAYVSFNLETVAKECKKF